jgi:hypothetical protein
MTAATRPEAVRLTTTFDAGRLAGELADVTGHRWRRQRIHNPGGSLGTAAKIDWRVLPLRSPGGDGERTDLLDVVKDERLNVIITGSLSVVHVLMSQDLLEKALVR